DKPDDYVHRIGRTGRAGLKGHAISFATPDQRRDVKDIEHIVKQTLPVSSLPKLPERRVPVPMKPYMHEPSDRRDHSRDNRPRRPQHRTQYTHRSATEDF